MFRNHQEAIQSLSWKRDGSLLVTTAKDKTMQIIDPRNKNTQDHLVIIKTNEQLITSLLTFLFKIEI